MGDLSLSVQGGSEGATAKQVPFKRRSEFSHLRIFLPRVTWVEPDELGRKRRRELAYDSDILSRLDWATVQTEALAQNWAPVAQGGLFPSGQQLQIGLDVLEHTEAVHSQAALAAHAELDRARLVRGLLDIAPNARWGWSGGQGGGGAGRPVPARGLGRRAAHAHADAESREGASTTAM